MSLLRKNGVQIMCAVGLLLVGDPHAVPAISQSGFWGKLAWDTAVGEGDTRFRYGNWYGPGWWGGSELDNRVGALPPVDALDAVAQKHDFGYELAEKLGRHDPRLEAHYKAIADAIAVRDTLQLPEDPRKWNPPAKDPVLARKYVERIALGFPNYQQRLNELKSVIPFAPDITNPEVLNAILDQQPGANTIISDTTFEYLVSGKVRRWNAEYKRRENRKAADRGDAIDRAVNSSVGRKKIQETGMVCTCEDWNRDGQYGVVIGKEIISANYGPYPKCIEFARALPVCQATRSDHSKKSSETAAGKQAESLAEKPMICTCEDWNRDGQYGVVIGKKIISANYGPYTDCMAYARGLAVCREK
jgi:hypothetical protein